MRYLKNWNNFSTISEAFKSEILSSYFTSLRNVPPGVSKGTADANRALNKTDGLLAQLLKIGKQLDFPIGEISDDFLFYLPYKEARALNYNVEDQICDETSKNLFDSNGIEGEVCKEGKVKRKWGKNIRSVTCTTCNGTGIKPKDRPDVKWIKFWFDVTGKFIRVTGTDGIMRDCSPFVETFTATNGKTYKKIRQVSITPGWPSSELRQGDLVIAYVSTQTRWRKVVGQVWEDGDDRYILQEWDTTTPGRLALEPSYIVDGELSPDYSHLKVKLEAAKKIWGENWDRLGDNGMPIYKAIEVQEDSQLDCNAALRIYGTGNLWCETDKTLDSDLKRANYAIVLDYLGLKKSGFKKKSAIRRERDEEREGLIEPRYYDEIRTENIRKRAQKLATKNEIGENLENLKVAYDRLTGGKYKFLDVVMFRKPYSSVSYRGESLVNKLEIFLKNRDKDFLDNANYTVKSFTEWNAENPISEILSGLRNIEKDATFVKIMDKLDELNAVVYDDFVKRDIKDLKDLKELNKKYNKIHEIANNSFSRSDNTDIEDFILTLRYFERERELDLEYLRDGFAYDITLKNIENLLPVVKEILSK